MTEKGMTHAKKKKKKKKKEPSHQKKESCSFLSSDQRSDNT